MARPKLALRSRSDLDLPTYARSIVHQLRESPAYAGQEPTPDEIEASVADYAASLAEVTDLRNQLRVAVTGKRNRRRALEQMLTRAALALTVASAGNKGAIIGGGFQVVHNTSPVGELPMPQNLRAVPGGFEGSIRLRWEAMRQARIFEIQSKPAGPGGEWTAQPSSTRSTVLVTGLTPGVRYSFQVRALGSAGPSPWSDPAFCRTL